MPEKLNYAGQMQPYDENNGEYKRFSSFHRPSENKLKGKTFYHGSPNKNITSFDEKYAGSNVGTDFAGIFFTDNKDFAEDFAYERKDSGSMFFDIKGEKGKVYQAELDMKNPLDLNNLTDKELKDIKENYLINNGLGKEENMRLLETYLKAGNIQGVKIFIDFKKMAKDGKYDGYIADLGNKYKGSNEYVIFKGSQAKIKNENNHKEKQLEIINKFNPMRDDYHTGIRDVKDIKTPQEAFDENDDENFVYPDFSAEDGKRALETGKIMVYSSKPISQGGFISPSKMMAQDYAGSGKIYSQLVDINDVAWINSDEGQYAKV